MSGNRQQDDDPDFLDDDFVLEDAGTKDDLEELFAEPGPEGAKAGARQQPPAKGKAGQPPESMDPEDTLFTDHTEGLAPSATFEGGKAFAEAGTSAWQGDGLELEPNGVPVDDEAGTPVERGSAAAAARADDKDSFADEIDSLLQSEEDFALDSEKELELVGGVDAAAGAGEAADTFVLDDGEGAWQAGAEQEQEGEQLAEAALSDGEEVLAEAELEPVDAEPTEPGWEPLPAAQMDELAEVDGVALTDGEQAVEGSDAEEAGEPQFTGAEGQRRPALVGAGVAAEPEGHDVYVNEPQVQVRGTRQGGRRGLRVLVSLAATLTVMAGGAVAVLRPEWLGLRLEPEAVQIAQVSRPVVDVPVPTPPAPTPAPVDVAPEVPKVAVEPPAPPAQLPVTAPAEPPKVAVTEPTPPVVAPTPEPTVSSTAPVVAATQPPAVVPAPVPSESTDAWPVPKVGEPTVVAQVKEPKPNQLQSGRLVRVSDDLMVGEQQNPTGPARPVDGMLPGSRAFAQMHNGNYFIGSVKSVDAERITLRVGTGEVTLQVAALSRLTELGSNDYEELQKVTSGFVRLTNNNRLVGGILSGIADDHVVLEFRSNRVMLPRSAVGEVVQGDGDAGVRLDTTREEDDWLRDLVERQLGTGTGAPAAPKPSAAPAPSGSRSPR